MPSGLVPQGEFDPIAYSDLVIDRAEVVPHNMGADPEFRSDFAVFQSLRNELNDSLLPRADLSCVV
jgi:hypothetical protein